MGALWSRSALAARPDVETAEVRGAVEPDVLRGIQAAREAGTLRRVTVHCSTCDASTLDAVAEAAGPKLVMVW
jgi:hypothetical protein